MFGRIFSKLILMPVYKNDLLIYNLDLKLALLTIHKQNKGK